MVSKEMVLYIYVDMLVLSDFPTAIIPHHHWHSDNSDPYNKINSTLLSDLNS